MILNQGENNYKIAAVRHRNGKVFMVATSGLWAGCEFLMGKWESLGDEQRRVVKNLEARLLKQSEEDEDAVFN